MSCSSGQSVRSMESGSVVKAQTNAPITDRLEPVNEDNYVHILSGTIFASHVFSVVEIQGCVHSTIAGNLNAQRYYVGKIFIRSYKLIQSHAEYKCGNCLPMFVVEDIVLHERKDIHIYIYIRFIHHHRHKWINVWIMPDTYAGSIWFTNIQTCRVAK